MNLVHLTTTLIFDLKATFSPIVDHVDEHFKVNSTPPMVCKIHVSYFECIWTLIYDHESEREHIECTSQNQLPLSNSLRNIIK